MKRALVVLTDGLRPDAVRPATMPVLHALAAGHTTALHADTVTPSVTVAALASLATGVAPATHGLVEPGLGFLTRLGSLRPLPRELGRARIPTVAVAGPCAGGGRAVAWSLAACAGVTRLLGADAAAEGVARAALPHLLQSAPGLTFVYLPDCDRAGHAHGWMSAAYLDAAAAVDRALAPLLLAAPDALTIVVADHGGGGVAPTDHDADHPLNRRIPLVLAGPGVRRRAEITRPVSLLDVPPTLLHWFGLPAPSSWEGAALSDAFAPVDDPALVAVA